MVEQDATARAGVSASRIQPRVVGACRVLWLGLALAALLAAWVAATLPFGAPDEKDHYLRALGIANGQLVGPKVPWIDPLISRAEEAWASLDSRGVLVPARLSPPGRPCVDGRLDVGRGECIEATHTGDYQPLPYLLPALSLSVSRDAATGLWLSRAASAVQCLVFIILAIALLWSGSILSVLGLLAAVSPQVLFVGSVVNPNGLEIAAGLAFAAGVLRVARDPSHAPAWVWVALAASGMVTALSWQLGLVFVLIDLVLLTGLLGRRRVRELLVARPRRLLLVCLGLLVSVGLFLGYGLSSGALHSSFSITPFGENLRLGVDQLREVFEQSVGVFGSLTVFLPAGAYWIWWTLVLALLGAALVLGSRRERVVLVFLAALGLLFPALFYAWIYKGTGFSLQGRYVLPILALVPMVAGEVVFGHQQRFLRWVGHRAMAGVVAIMAGFQLLAWWIAASNAAGEPHTFWFFTHPAWSPPIGWWPWALLAILGSTALLTSAAWQPLRRRRPLPV